MKDDQGTVIDRKLESTRAQKTIIAADESYREAFIAFCVACQAGVKAGLVNLEAIETAGQSIELEAERAITSGDPIAPSRIAAAVAYRMGWREGIDHMLAVDAKKRQAK